MVSVLMPSWAVVLSSSSSAGVALARLSLPTRSRFIDSPSAPLLPLLGMASVRFTLASATRPRYQPQPLEPRTATAASAARTRVPIASRPVRPRPPDEEPPADEAPDDEAPDDEAPDDEAPRPSVARDGRPARGSRRAGRSGRRDSRRGSELLTD